MIITQAQIFFPLVQNFFFKTGSGVGSAMFTLAVAAALAALFFSAASPKANAIEATPAMKMLIISSKYLIKSPATMMVPNNPICV